MSEEPDYRIDEFEGQMEAASSLIKSLEEEVESLCRDLEEASFALQMARQEVSARGQALEEKDLARVRAEQQAQALREAMASLRIQNSDEQLQLRNQHIAELARMQDRFGAQRISDIGKTFVGDEAVSLKDEYQRDLQELEQRHRREIEALESSYKEWRAEFLEDEKELKEQHAVEIQNLRQDAESQRKELQRTLREDYEQRLEETRQSLEARREEEVQALRESSEERERDLQREHQASLETLRERSERDLREAEEKHQQELREIKAVAENRERELRRGQSARSKEASDEAERRLASLQAQRKADNEALKSRYGNELASLRREHEERLATEVDRRRREVLALEEKLESAKLERASETRAYMARLKELELKEPEAPPPGPRNGHGGTEPTVEEKAPDTAVLRRRVAELEKALDSSRATTEQLTAELEEWRAKDLDEDVPGTGIPNSETKTAEDPVETSELSAPGMAEDDTRVRELEIRLQEAQEERRQYADELGKALDKLQRLSDPEHRLRAGIAAFNESNHSRNVASISKALGLPDVHAGVEGDVPGKPVFTFVWEDISWRRYVAEPIEGLEEPRVYLVASGDDPEEDPPPHKNPNARIDARGRLILGVQAR